MMHYESSTTSYTQNPGVKKRVLLKCQYKANEHKKQANKNKPEQFRCYKKADAVTLNLKPPGFLLEKV